MTRSSGPLGGSYRQTVAAERAAAREREQYERKVAKERLAAETAGREEEAVAKTEAIGRRVFELENLLRSSLDRDPRINLGSLKIKSGIPPFVPGSLADQIPEPDWFDFAPEPPGGLGRLLGGGRRYQALQDAAAKEHAAAVATWRHREAERQRRLVEARSTWEREAAEAERRNEAHNAHLDEIAAGLRVRDRFAVSEYMQMTLDRSPYPALFPTERHVGYVPESSLVAVEWFLPTFEVIPEHKSFRHIKTRKIVESVDRSPADRHRLYNSVIAQIAVRTIREVFTAAPASAVSTVVFNGHVDTVDPATGRKIRPPLISLRATREKFDELVLAEPRFDPVASIKRHFFATISPHPEELKAVEPVMPFSRADPRVIEAIDVISGLDQRPNLLDLTPTQFESFVQNLFTKMGYETDQFRASHDGGIDCMAYKRDPVAPMKIAVQAKLYTKTVSPGYVRELYGTMVDEGATLGIMVTTSGYGPTSEAFANGKPLHLIDGPGLISICQEHGIPARILGLGTRRRKP